MGFSEHLSGRQKIIISILLACVNLAIFVTLGRVVYALLIGESERPPAVRLSRPEPSPSAQFAYPPTWTVTPTSTPWPSRSPTFTPLPTTTRTATLRPTSTPVLPLLTMPVSIAAKDESNRQARMRIIESAANAYRDKFPVVILLGIAALESQGSFSNRVADHGVMGVTPKAGRCYTLVYRDTAFDLRQNVSDAACHLNGYAWDRASGSEAHNLLVKNAVRNAGYSDYVAQVVAAVHWYAGETKPSYLTVLADIIDGQVDTARSVPENFGYRNPSLAQALRIAYRALTTR